MSYRPATPSSMEAIRVDVTLNYAKTGLSVTLPDHCAVKVVNKHVMPVLDDPATNLRRALAEARTPLAELAAGAETACILICDVTRPVPNGMILPELLGVLLGAGMRAENIVVLVATGLHRPNEGQELRDLVGSDMVLSTVRVENHFAKNAEDHVLVGVTSKGTQIKVDKRFAQADLKLVTGLVEPHFMAGYSGGRKVILPGVAHEDTITRFHTATFLEHPNAANCVLEGNPLNQDQLEGVAMLGPCYAVNVVLDDKRRVSFCNFGPLESSHLEAVAFARPYCETQLDRRYKTVVTSAAGFPLDLTYYQTVKGMVGAMDALELGGRIFIASACTLGLGSPEYRDAQERLVRLGPDGFLNDILPKTRAAMDEWQTEMQLKPMRQGEIVLYTDGLSDEDKALTGVSLADDLSAAIAQWIGECGDPNVLVIPEGPYITPRPPKV